MIAVQLAVRLFYMRDVRRPVSDTYSTHQTCVKLSGWEWVIVHFVARQLSDTRLPITTSTVQNVVQSISDSYYSHMHETYFRIICEKKTASFHGVGQQIFPENESSCTAKCRGSSESRSTRTKWTSSSVSTDQLHKPMDIKNSTYTDILQLC